MYNKTQLDIEKASERGILHRDYIAHCFRWSHVMKHAKMGMRLLDVGCGLNTPMAMTFYTNKFRPALYLGLDMRHKFKYTQDDFPFPYKTQGHWDCTDTMAWVDMYSEFGEEWNMVTCFEVLEHMPKESGLALLENLANYCGGSQIFLSTPCFNGSKAANHIYEWGYQELKEQLENDFIIEAHYGTFASQREIKPFMTDSDRSLFDVMHKYYDSNVLSIIFAPKYPSHSRNCIWQLRVK